MIAEVLDAVVEYVSDVVSDKDNWGIVWTTKWKKK